MTRADIAFNLGRRLGKQPCAGKVFCVAERFLPLKRIRRTPVLVSFYHPRPIANPHIIIVPTQPVTSLDSRSRSINWKSDILWQMLLLGREISQELSADAQWKMMINGGVRQDIGQMHGHLLPLEIGDWDLGITVPAPASDPEFWRDILGAIERLSREGTEGYSVLFTWFNLEPAKLRIS